MTRRTARRPTALTEEVEKRLLEAIRGGVLLTHAAIYAGVAPSTFHGRVARGEAERERLDAGGAPDPRERPFLELLENVTRARADAAVPNFALLQKAAQGGYVVKETTRTYVDEAGRRVTERTKTYADLDWRAAAKLLELSFPREFGRHMQLEVSGRDSGPLQVQGWNRPGALGRPASGPPRARRAQRLRPTRP